MINTPDRLERAILDLVQTTAEEFSEGTQKTQADLWRKLRGMLNDLSIDGKGNIKKTASNRAILSRVRRAVMPLILTDAYKSRVSKFTGAYGKLGKINDEYFRFLVDAFKPNAGLFNDLRDEAVGLTVNSLTEAGLEANMVNPIKAILNQNINGGAAVFDLEEQLRTFIVGNDDRLGRLERYTGQITRDALNQFGANYHQLTADGLGMEWVFYSRGTVDDTRPFCADRNGRYFHVEEVREWGSIPSWKGRIPGTNSSTIFTYRGGYNCMHQLTYVHASMVPKDVKDRAIAKGLIKGKITEPQATSGGKAPDGFQFGPDLPKEIRDKFTFNGNSPNMPDNFGEYGIDLPDQFWDLMPEKVSILDEKGNAWYNGLKRAANMPLKRIKSRSDYYQRSIWTHEIGHANHNLLEVIDTANTNGSVAIEFQNLYKSLRKTLKNSKSFKDGVGFMQFRAKDLISEMQKKFPDFSRSEISTMVGNLADTIQAITNGKDGYGHARSYWKQKNAKYAELFAHLNENFWVGNPVFKELYPEIYEEGIKFMTDLYGF